MTSTLVPPPPGYAEVPDPEQPGRGQCGTCHTDVTTEPCPTHGPASLDLVTALDVPPDVLNLARIARFVIRRHQALVSDVRRSLGIPDTAAGRYLDTLEKPWGVIARSSPDHSRRVVIHADHADCVSNMIVACGGVPLTPDPFADLTIPPLSPRDLTIIDLIARGLTNKAIGHRMGLSLETVKTHISRILRVVGSTSRVSLVQRCHLLGVFGGVPNEARGPRV